MAKEAVVCTHCAARYQRGALRAGARVTCRKCGKAFVVDAEVPAEPELEELPEAPAAPLPRSGATGKAAGAERRRFTPAAASAPRKTLVLISALLSVTLAIVAFLALRTRGAETGKPVGAPPQPARPRSGKVLHDDLMAQAAAASRPADQISHLLAAANAASGAGWSDPEEAKRQREAVLQKIRAIDPEHELANRLLGLVKYAGLDQTQAGRWLTPDAARALDQQIEGKRKAEEDVRQAERDRWEKNPWTRRARRIADAWQKLMPGERKLGFVFDVEAVPRPYFLMVEQSADCDPVQVAADLGPRLGALRAAFKTRYQDVIPAAGADNDRLEMRYVIPVLVFADVRSYTAYRKANQDVELPSENLAGAFYVSRSVLPDDYCGMLYVWRDRDFHEKALHEATHQLMHYASLSADIGRTPWLQEGIAEFFSAHTPAGDGYRFGGIVKDRAQDCRRAARAYLDADESKRETRRSAGYLTPRMLVYFDRDRFAEQMRVLDGRSRGDMATAREEVALIYALGWGLIHFCNTHAGGKYRKGFEAFLRRELVDQEADPEDFGKDLGLKTDADWAGFSSEFFEFCATSYR